MVFKKNNLAKKTTYLVASYGEKANLQWGKFTQLETKDTVPFVCVPRYKKDTYKIQKSHKKILVRK